MILEVLGKAHKSGISKKNNPYDFTEIHYLTRRHYVEGLVGASKTVDSQVMRYEDITINSAYNIEFDENGHIIKMTIASKPQQKL